MQSIVDEYCTTLLQVDDYRTVTCGPSSFACADCHTSEGPLQHGSSGEGHLKAVDSNARGESRQLVWTTCEKHTKRKKKKKECIGGRKMLFCTTVCRERREIFRHKRKEKKQQKPLRKKIGRRTLWVGLEEIVWTDRDGH